MNRQQLIEHIKEEFGVSFDKPFKDDFDSMVFRHKDSKKWFALVMQVKRNKLVGQDERFVDVLNLKCDPILRHALLQNKGVYVAYHMNKVHWISVILEEAEFQDVATLVEMSFDLTKK